MKPSLKKLYAIRKKARLEFLRNGVKVMSKPSNLICEIKFGSHLYGTNTDQSDEDYKGIFIPSPEDVLLGKIPRTSNSSEQNAHRKNLPGELDCEYYSLHHFLKLAKQGQTVAIDMLFAPDTMVHKTKEFGWVWDKIIEHRQKLLSTKMQAFVGYARGQAAKYSLKGDRLNKLQKFADVLQDCVDEDPLRDYWDEFPRDDERVGVNCRELQIAGKWYGETTSVRNVMISVNNSLNRYGARAKAAADADGVDWKAMSHAVRVSKELSELLSFRQINFPLRDADLILKIKLGQLPLERVQNILDLELKFIEVQAQQSTLPDHVDHKWWDKFLVDVMSDYLYNEWSYKSSILDGTGT